MARQYGSYSPAIPLGITWVELLILEDDDGNLVDISDFELRCQFYDDLPTRDTATGFATTDPVFEIISSGADYSTAPVWPVYEAITLPGTGTDGEILIELDVDDLWTASPSNAKRRLRWELQLWDPVTDETLPVVQGKCTFLPATTMRGA